MKELPCQVLAQLVQNSGSSAGCGQGVWVGKTWEVASSVSVGFLIQTQNKTKLWGTAERKFIDLSTEGQFWTSQFLSTRCKLTCIRLSLHF